MKNSRTAERRSSVDDGTVEGRTNAGVPHISIVVPVNAQGDLENVEHLLSDIARYDGRLSVETILVVNNFPPGQVPSQVEKLRERAVVLAIPNGPDGRALGDRRKFGEAVPLSARMQGIRVARSPYVILTDADCRLPYPTAYIDWYHDRLSTRAVAAYTLVVYQDYPPAPSIRFKLGLSHAARWVKRVILRIPTTQGASFGVRRDKMLELYEAGVLADDLNVGPAFKRLVGPVAYASRKGQQVLTSGRMFKPGWMSAVPYFLYRLRYNLRVLPVRPGVAHVTGRENDPVRRYQDNRPILNDDC